MFERNGVLKLGCYHGMVEWKYEPPADRCSFLDYMSPEMLSIKVHQSACLCLVSLSLSYWPWFVCRSDLG